MLFDYQHHIVRDLAWAIASPPLLIPEKTACIWYKDKWYQDLYVSSKDWLHKLDDDPEQLQDRLDSQKDRRLGRYFETLWAFWLEHSSRFDVIEQNLPLRDDGKTLGEIDFLVFDKKLGKCLHWEVAVKFYLGVGNTRRHANWHGPGKKDRLDLKVEHLSNRQSVICQRPVVKALLQERGYQVDACGVILKGRLFYPTTAYDTAFAPVDASPGHLRSYWLSMEDFLKRGEKSSVEEEFFYPLVGFGWLAAVDQTTEIPRLNRYELAKLVKIGDYRLPLCVFCRQKQASRRIFIVPDDWARELCGRQGEE